MSNPKCFLNWFSNHIDEDNVVEARKVKLLVFIHVFGISSILIALFLYLFTDIRFIPLSYIITTLSLHLISLLSIKWVKSLTISSNLYIFSNLIAITISVYLFGGGFSPLVVWLFLQPIIALSTLNKRYGTIWLIIVSITTIYIATIATSAYPLNISDAQFRLLITINVICFGATIFYFQSFLIALNSFFTAKLQAEQQQNKTILDNLPAGVAYLNKDLKITYINPAVSKIFKVSYDNIINKKVTDVFQSEFFNYNQPYYGKVLNGEIVTFEREVTIQNEIAYLRSTYVPLRNEKEKITGLITLTEDISLAKKDELEKLAHQRKKQKELKSELDTRNRELASQQLFMTNQKSLLKGIKDTILNIEKTIPQQKKKQLQSVINTIDQNLASEEQWESFQIQFGRIHPNFTRKLQKEFKSLTQRDLRHCAYLKMSLSYKEIAQLLNVSYKTVEMTSYRIKKKLNLDSNIRLGDYLRQL